MTENAVTWLFQTGVERIKGCREASFWFDARLHASGASLIRPSQRKSLSRVVEPSSQKSLDADFRFLWEPSFRPQSLRGAPAWVSGPRTTAGCLLGQFLGQRPTGTNATQRGHVGHVVQSHRLRDYLGPDRPETREEGFVRGPHHALREPGFRGWREQEPPELETQRAPQTSVQRNPR